ARRGIPSGPVAFLPRPGDLDPARVRPYAQRDRNICPRCGGCLMLVGFPSGRLARVLLVSALLLLFTAPARADLDSYVKKLEPDFSWKLTGKRTIPFLGTVYDIELVSQTWQKITWKHDLQVVVPNKVEPKSTLFLYNQGGKPNDTSLFLALDLARK